MTSLQRQLNSLQAWAQEELAGQRRMLAVVERQERTLCANDPLGLAAATRDLEGELALQSERIEKRKRLFAAFAAHWQADAAALSLKSILERCPGESGLVQLRESLRASTSELLRRNRRFAALAAAHRRLVEELVDALLEAGDPGQRARGGSLVDARA